MPGFGSGPFGREPFGSWEWSKTVLYGLIPAVYRQKDEDSGGLLSTFIDALRPSFDDLRLKIQTYGDLRAPLQVRTQYSETAVFKLGTQFKREGTLEQRGLEGSVTALQYFKATAARFRPEDIGKSLTITNSSVVANNRVFTITSIIDSNTVATTPLLTIDSSRLRWELRAKAPASDGYSRYELRSGNSNLLRPGWILSDGRSQFSVKGRRNFRFVETERKHLTEKEGLDGSVDSANRFYAPSGSFSQVDVGKKISLSGSTAVNNGWSEIVWVKDSSTVSTSLLEIQGAGAAAQLIVAGQITYTAPKYGEFYNAVTITCIASGLSTPLSVSVTGTAVTIHLQTNGAGTPISTDTDIAAALLANVDAAPLVRASTAGTTVSAMATTSLAGGLDLGTVRYFLRPGAEGTRVFHENAGPSTSFSIIVTGQDIHIQLETDGGGNIVTTGADIVAQIQTSVAASLLVSIEQEAGTASGAAGATPDFMPVRGVGLATDTGPFYWALLPFPTLILKGDAVPTGVVEQEGVDGILVYDSTIPSNVFVSTSAKFSVDDVGKKVTISGSRNPANNLTYTVGAFVNPNKVVLLPATGIVLSDVDGDRPLRWCLRIGSAYLDQTTVTGHAPSIINYFAEDFGIEVDLNEREDRQRSYVEHFNQWFGLKGGARSYSILGTISGVDATPIQIYRVTKEIYAGIPDGSKYEIDETSIGRQGQNGTLTFVGSRVRFTSPEALFTHEDLGREIKILGAPTSGNNKYYTIETIISSNTVEFELGDSATTPETISPPSGWWGVVRLYSSKAPTRPLYDEINTDALTEWVSTNLVGKVFGVDRYCWEPDFAAYVTATVVSATFTSTGNYTVVVTAACEVITGVGHWELVYADGTEIFIETLPVSLGGGNWSFTVNTLTPPATGSAKIRYNCDIQLSCDFCCSNRLVVVVEYATSAFDTAAELERLQDRINDRLYQVVPAHVEMVTTFNPTLSASLILKSSVIV